MYIIIDKMTSITCQFCLRKMVTNGTHCSVCDICDECYFNVHSDYKYIIDVILSEPLLSNVFKENRKSTFLQVILYVFFDLSSDDMSIYPSRDTWSLRNTICNFRKIWKCPYAVSMNIYLNFEQIFILVNWLISDNQPYRIYWLQCPLFCMPAHIEMIFIKKKYLLNSKQL